MSAVNCLDVTISKAVNISGKRVWQLILKLCHLVVKHLLKQQSVRLRRGRNCEENLCNSLLPLPTCCSSPPSSTPHTREHETRLTTEVVNTNTKGQICSLHMHLRARVCYLSNWDWLEVHWICKLSHLFSLKRSYKEHNHKRRNLNQPKFGKTKKYQKPGAKPQVNLPQSL